MPCYNCTSRVLRIFLQDSIAASISRPRPHLQHYFFRQQQQRFSLHTRVPFHINRRSQSTLTSGSTTPPPTDDDYIPFGQPIPTTNGRILASDDSGLYGLLPPPPPTPISAPLRASHVVYGYEPEVEILKLPEAEPESQAREVESKRTIELLRRKIEASWARRSAVHKSMAETGLPVVGGGVDLLEDARLAVSQVRVTGVMESGSNEGAGEGSRKAIGGGKRKLPSMKEIARREVTREVNKRKKEQAREIQGLSPSEARAKLKKIRRKEEGKWGVSKVASGKPMERRLKFNGDELLKAKEYKESFFKVRESKYRDGVGVQRTILVGPSQDLVPVVEQSLPKLTEARAPSIQEFIRDQKDPFDRKAFSRERAKIRKSVGEKERVNQRQRSALHNEVKEDSGQKQKCGKGKSKLPPIDEVKKESKTGEWDTKKKLQHYVATTPKSKIEAWKVQKAALQKKFGMGWAPLKKLSPTARGWVKELHRRVPELTTEKLSETFKVSPEVIRRILRAKWVPSPREEQEREERWLRRRAKIWERWIDEGRVQTKGMKPEVRKLNAEKGEKWLKQKDEAFKRYSEKKRRAMPYSAKGHWRAPWERFDKRPFRGEPEPSGAGDMTGKAKHAQDVQKKVEWRRERDRDREYRERLAKAKSSEASTVPSTKRPTEGPVKPPRFL